MYVFVYTFTHAQVDEVQQIDGDAAEKFSSETLFFVEKYEVVWPRLRGTADEHCEHGTGAVVRLAGQDRESAQLNKQF